MLRLLQGHPADAEKLLVDALPRSIQSLGPEHYVTLHLQRVFGRVLADEGRLDEAEARLKTTRSAQLRTKINEDPHGTARTELYLGGVLVEEGKPDEAEPLLKEALAFFGEDEASKSRPELAAQAANWLGTIQLGHKDYSGAETLLLPGSDRFFTPGVEMSPNERHVAVGHIVSLYAAWGKQEQAAVWQKKLDALAPPAGNQ